MNTLTPTHLHGTEFRLAAGTALRLGRHRGELRLTQGRLWLTGSRTAGDDDRVLAAGERCRIAVGDDVVIESYDAGSEAVFRWVAPPRVAFGMLGEAARRGVAVLAFGLARVFATWARSAASSARRAQGRIA